ncbi:MAG: type III PLP-dependent enzyme [Rhizobiaceae bacterium]
MDTLVALATKYKAPTAEIASKMQYANSDAVAKLLQPDEPILCFSPTALRQQADQFLAHFPGKTAYALKANPHPQVIKTLFSQGINTFDVASPVEMELVKLHAPKAKIHYHNPVKSSKEIATAYHQYGCKRFAVDHLDELTKIAEVIGGDRDIQIAVRLRLPSTATSVHDFSSKFGATKEEVVSLLREVKSLGYQPLVTFHPGSQCHDPAGWVHYLEAVADIQHKSGVALIGLNIGGGFPAIYQGAAITPLTTIFATIKKTIRVCFGNECPPLECEPGRALVAPSVTLLTRVKLVRRELGEIFINDGIYGSLMEANQTSLLTPQHRVLKSSKAPTQNFTVFGPTCDPLDLLPIPLELPSTIAEGDYIEFLSIGAYGSATITKFNGYGEAEMLMVEDIRQATPNLKA